MSGSLVKMNHGEAVVINTTAVDTMDVANTLRVDPQYKAVADSLYGWAERVSGPPGGRRRRRVGGLLDRDRWLTPDSTFDKIRLAREAMRDDIVGNAADGTEAFALSKVGVYCDDIEAEDVWNQWAGDINLDDQLRKAWRVLFSDSQMCVLNWWDRRSYKVRGTTDGGNAKRKTFDNMLVPIGWTYLDTAKIVPVGSLMFGQEKLCYRPTAMEAMHIERVLAHQNGLGDTWRPPTRMRMRAGGPLERVRIPTEVDDALELDDPLISQLIIGRYKPGITEWRLLQEDGVDPTYLYEMNPDIAWRHTLTRPDYQRFADVRLESVFELLDMKAQLRQLDRITLIGGAHYILLIKIGDDKVPGQQPEIDAFRAQAFTLASVPVIVGDQRLNIEILTPKQDHTLERTKYDTINSSIFERAWSSFHHDVSRTEDPLKTAKVIAKNLESRRLMLRRTIEREIIDKMRRRNADQLKDRAKLVFTPSQISLAFDPAFASYLLDLRASNEISRDTALGTFDISQEDEARMREREEKSYDRIFKTIAPAGTAKQAGGRVPAGDPNDDPGAARAQQRRAGRQAKGGGGTSDGSGRGQPARHPRNLANENNKPSLTAASLLEADHDELLEIAKDLEIVGRSRMRNSELRVAIRKERIARRLRAIEDNEIETLDDLENLFEEEDEE